MLLNSIFIALNLLSIGIALWQIGHADKKHKWEIDSLEREKVSVARACGYCKLLLGSLVCWFSLKWKEGALR
jgi:hypothetical protein